MRVEAALVGGTGTGAILERFAGRSVHISTEYGPIRGRIVVSNGASILVLSRHSAGHKVPPHKVNYRGLACAANQLGARVCMATAAVGSLHADWPPGTLAICSDFVDVSGRNPTLHDRTVEHCDFSEPFSIRAREAIACAATECRTSVLDQCVYVNGAGPRYETPHEIKLFKSLGDVVGMTAASEAVPMREIGIDYACLAIVTNLAAGLTASELSHSEVVEVMQRIGPTVVELLLASIVNYLQSHGA